MTGADKRIGEPSDMENQQKESDIVPSKEPVPNLLMLTFAHVKVTEAVQIGDRKMEEIVLH
jgi:hypothetical protein